MGEFITQGDILFQQRTTEPEETRRARLIPKVGLVDGRQCPVGCVYCFTNIAAISKNIPQLETALRENWVQDVQTKPKAILLPIDIEITALAPDQIRNAFDLILKQTPPPHIFIESKGGFANHLLSEAQYLKLFEEYSEKLKARNRILSVAITITSSDNNILTELEPNAPDFDKRIDVIKQISRLNIPVSVAIRPLIPQASLRDLQKVVNSSAKAGAIAVHSGSFYMDDQMALLPMFTHSKDVQRIIQANATIGVPIHKIVQPGKLSYLKSMAEQKGLLWTPDPLTLVEFIYGNHLVNNWMIIQDAGHRANLYFEYEANKYSSLLRPELHLLPNVNKAGRFGVYPDRTGYVVGQIDGNEVEEMIGTIDWDKLSQSLKDLRLDLTAEMEAMTENSWQEFLSFTNDRDYNGLSQRLGVDGIRRSLQSIVHHMDQLDQLISMQPQDRQGLLWVLSSIFKDKNGTSMLNAQVFATFLNYCIFRKTS